MCPILAMGFWVPLHQYYKVCLAEETPPRREFGLALLLRTDVRAYSVQMALRCGTKNAQSTAAGRELFEERYRSSSPRQVAIGLIGGMSVCTNSVGAPDWPTDLGDPAAARLPLAKLKGEPLSSGYRPRRSTDQLSVFCAEDIVHIPTDALQLHVLRVPSLTPLLHRVARYRCSARATCSRRCASSLPPGVPSSVASALPGLYRRNCRARSARLASWPTP